MHLDTGFLKNQHSTVPLSSELGSSHWSGPDRGQPMGGDHTHFLCIKAMGGKNKIIFFEHPVYLDKVRSGPSVKTDTNQKQEENCWF